MEISPLSKDAYHALLRRLQGSGYASDPESARDQELGAVAQIAAMAGEGLVRASRNLLLGSAVESLDIYERVRFFVGSASLSVARRQKRLLAFAQGATKLVEARLSHAMATYLGAANGTTLRPSQAQLEDHGASPLGAFVLGRREPAADWHGARDLDPVLERGLPARALSGRISAPPGDAPGLTYGQDLSASPIAIGVMPGTNVPSQTKGRAAPVAFYPGAVVTRDAWLEVQAMLLFKSRGFSIDQAAQGRTHLVVAELAEDGTVELDLEVSWAHRFVSAWGAVTGVEEADLTALGAAEHVWLPPSKLGAAGGGPTHAFVSLDGSDPGIAAHVDGDGHLVITNTGAARSVTLLVSSSPLYESGSATDTQPWIDPDAVDHDELGEMYAGTVISDGAPGMFGGEAAGATRRIVYTGGLTRETGAGAVRSVVLDSSEDYRRRYLLVVPLTFTVGAGADPTYYPAASAEGLTPRGLPVEAPRLFYTGDGVEPGNDELEPNQHPDRVAAPDVWLFADEDGNLCAEMKAVSAHKSACLMAMVIATERTDGESTVTPVPVHATVVQTLDLEQPQHCGVFAQGHQGGAPRGTPTAPPLRALPTCPPLGLINEGHAPLRPISWQVRERLGTIADTTFEVRQPITRQRRRLVSITVLGESTTPVDDFNVATELALGVNDQIDFRDRFVWIEGRYSATDIRVTGEDGPDDTGTPFFVAFYAGPYADIEVMINETLSVVFEFSRAGAEGGYHSRLCFKNVDADDVYVNAHIECSGFLGLTDLRHYGVVNGFAYSDTDEIMYDENLGYSDDSGFLGGPYRG